MSSSQPRLDPVANADQTRIEVEQQDSRTGGKSGTGMNREMKRKARKRKARKWLPQVDAQRARPGGGTAAPPARDDPMGSH